MLPRLIPVLLLFLPSIIAAFTHHERDCWSRDCVVRTDAGTLCFEPHHNGIEQDECADSFLKNLTRIHLTSTIGRSIVYYDHRARVLGAATWAIPPAMAGSVFVCMTGRRLDNPKRYRTVCRETHHDDDMRVAAVHANECVSDQKPRYVNDGCFSLGTSAGADDDDKEWYENPVVAGFVWVLGLLVTLGTMYLWGGKAVRAIRARLPKRLVALTAVVERLCRRWRRTTSQLPTQHPATLLQQAYTSGSVPLALFTVFCANAYSCCRAALRSETFV